MNAPPCLQKKVYSQFCLQDNKQLLPAGCFQDRKKIGCDLTDFHKHSTDHHCCTLHANLIMKNTSGLNTNYCKQKVPNACMRDIFDLALTIHNNKYDFGLKVTIKSPL